MHRNIVLLCLFCLSLFSSCSGVPDDRPNILLISLDTLRADHLGLYGYYRDTSPNLDRLGEQSFVFENVVSQASSTLPSHRALFASRYPSQITEEDPMLAEVLSGQGYDAAGFTGGGNVSAVFGFKRGFPTYFEAPPPYGSLADSFPRFERWLRKKRSKPFFIFLHTYDIHHPYDPPEEYQRLFREDYRGDLTGAQTGLLLNKARKVHQFADFKGDVDIPPEDRKWIEALYDSGIRHIDDYIPRIRALLEETGEWDNTIVVILADHGEEFWEHGSVLHSFTLFQEVVHVPLVIHLPSSDLDPIRVPDTVRLIDVAPTLLDLVDIDLPGSFDGRSLLPLMEGQVVDPRGAGSEMLSLRSWIDWPWKLVVDGQNHLELDHPTRDPGKADELPPTGTDRSSDRQHEALELYNLEEDPGEFNNLSASQADLVLSMSGVLNQELPVGSSIEMVDEMPDDETVQEQLRALGYIE